MAWTLPVAVFFTCIVLMLVGMTVWELKSPTVAAQAASCRSPPRAATACSSACWRRPTSTWPSSAVSEKLIDWFGLAQEPSIWISFVLSMAVLALIMRTRLTRLVHCESGPAASPGPCRINAHGEVEERGDET